MRYQQASREGEAVKKSGPMRFWWLVGRVKSSKVVSTFWNEREQQFSYLFSVKGGMVLLSPSNEILQVPTSELSQRIFELASKGDTRSVGTWLKACYQASMALQRMESSDNA